MSGLIPKHFIDDVIARADIVDVIGSRVQLKKAGKEFKACCPFHGEKTASFTVVPDKQFYHCFGCGAHGTVIGFLMDHDHLSFVEAIEELAARLGLQVPREEDPNAKPKPADDLFTPLERAAKLYADQLLGSERAIQYVKKRGLTRETVQRFLIGYAPDSWDFIGKSLGHSEDEAHRLLQVGLVIERERGGQKSGHYDRFRDRIMFPIRDTRGRVIAFGGRILDQGEPKYLNSPETELFHKGRELYGLFEARQSMRSIKRLLVVEGYMDVVRLHQAGVNYAVATLGTATTPEHLTRIFRVCSEVVFCFDGDRAGRAAAWRALENALPQIREGRQIRFLFLPEGHDPDSLVGEEGREKFEARLDTALALSDYLLRELSSRSDVHTVDGRAQLAEAAKPLIARIPPGVYRELLVDALAQIVGMTPDRLRGLIDPESAASMSAADERQPAPPPQGNVTGRSNLVRHAINLLVQFPQCAQSAPDPSPLQSIDRPGIPLLIELINSLKANPCTSTGALLERWRDRPEFTSLSKLALQKIVTPAEGASVEIAGAIERLVAEAKVDRSRQLLSKQEKVPLTEAETRELQGLLTAKAGRNTEPGTGVQKH